MNAIFTIPYTELLVVEYLNKHFPNGDGFSVLLPASRQQKGFDLVLAKRKSHGSAAVTFQVKGSRTYLREPSISKTGKRKFRFYTWFPRFSVAPEADFFVLVALYPSKPATAKRSAAAWASHFLLFTNDEMKQIMRQVKTKTGKPDSSFGFGFDHAKEAVLTRGMPGQPDYSKHLFARRHAVVMRKCQR